MMVIPVLPVNSLAESLPFYRALGFEVTHEQTWPYEYGAVMMGDVHLHFTKPRGSGAQQGTSLCLVMVADVGAFHGQFSDRLRAHFGRVLTVGTPRITRLRPGQTRFHLFDPRGNVLLFIAKDEGEYEYLEYDEALSPLAQSLLNAEFLRDTYTNDEGAARVLDKALARVEAQGQDVEAVELARVLAARAEIAVALGDETRAEALQVQMAALALPPEAWEMYGHELRAAEETSRWIGGD